MYAKCLLIIHTVPTNGDGARRRQTTTTTVGQCAQFACVGRRMRALLGWACLPYKSFMQSTHTHTHTARFVDVLFHLVQHTHTHTHIMCVLGALGGRSSRPPSVRPHTCSAKLESKPRPAAAPTSCTSARTRLQRKFNQTNDSQS